MFELLQNLKESDKPAQLRITCHSPPSSFFTTTAHLAATTNFQASYISWHSVQGHVAAECHLLPTPTPARKERSCHQAHATRRRATLGYTHCLHESGWRTHLHPPTKLRLHSPTLDSLGSPSSIRPPHQGLEIHHHLSLLPQLCARRGAHTS